MRLYKLSLLFLFLGVLHFSCQKKDEDNNQADSKSSVIDLLEIKASGELRALVDNSSTSYFLYKGTPMGFEYELLSRFAKAIKVKLTVIPISNLDHIIDSLQLFKGDVIAANLTITKNRANQIAYSSPLIRSKQVLVQRNEKSAGKFVSRPSELGGKSVYVRKNSSFYKRLENLSEEIGEEIQVVEAAGNVTVEQLIKKVSDGEIDYTVADEHVAKINKSFYPNINLKVPVSLEQKMAWAVRKDSPDLLIAMNEWLRNFKKTVDFRVIYLKYFGNTGLYRKRIKSELFTSKSGKLSPYDGLVREYSRAIDWDWRLIVSLMYQESQFKQDASSWAGAIGLMQLMPETAAQYGVDTSSGAAANIQAGISYLQWLNKQFETKVTDHEERQQFVLAAYNVGLGHVFDAIRLAKKHELDANKWQGNVAKMLLNKSKPKYYKDTAAYYGYCRGSEPYKYVNEILERFEHYKNITELAEAIEE